MHSEDSSVTQEQLPPPSWKEPAWLEPEVEHNAGDGGSMLGGCHRGSRPVFAAIPKLLRSSSPSVASSRCHSWSGSHEKAVDISLFPFFTRVCLWSFCNRGVADVVVLDASSARWCCRTHAGTASVCSLCPGRMQGNIFNLQTCVVFIHPDPKKASEVLGKKSTSPKTM